MSNLWPKFSKERPCPACGRWDWTCRAGDRAFVCMRVASERTAKDGGFYHFYDSAKLTLPPPRLKLPSAPSVDPRSVKGAEINLDVLAGELGVTVMALQALGVIWSNQYHAWLFPMKNGKGELVGWNRRFPNGEKKIVAGMKGGLYIPQSEPQEIVFICEGGSDTAALYDMGLFGIGRFNVLSGAADLKQFLSTNRIFRAVIIADNDTLKKYNGGKGRPGIEGALRLKKDLGVNSVIWMPPSPCKDVREFKNRGGTAAMIYNEIKNKIWSKK